MVSIALRGGPSSEEEVVGSGRRARDDKQK